MTPWTWLYPQASLDAMTAFVGGRMVGTAVAPSPVTFNERLIDGSVTDDCYELKAGQQGRLGQAAT